MESLVESSDIQTEKPHPSNNVVWKPPNPDARSVAVGSSEIISPPHRQARDTRVMLRDSKAQVMLYVRVAGQKITRSRRNNVGTDHTSWFSNSPNFHLPRH